MVTVVENGPSDQSSNPRRGSLHLTSINSFRKGKHPTIPSPAMVKQSDRQSASILVCQPIWKENTEFKRVKLRFKIDLVSHLFLFNSAMPMFFQQG